MNEFTKLQTQYLAGIENMSADDASRFLELLKADPEAPFRDTRIPILERHLSQIELMSEAELAWERTWRAAAQEYIELTERWLDLGATWRSIGTALTVWEYEGARKADARLAEIISRKQENK